MNSKTKALCVVTVLLLIISSLSVLSISAKTQEAEYETAYFQESVDDAYTYKPGNIQGETKYLEKTVEIEAVAGVDTITVKAIPGGYYAFGVKESTPKFNERTADMQCRSFSQGVQIIKALMGDVDRVVGAVPDADGVPVRVKPNTEYVIFCFKLDRSTLPANATAFGTTTVRTLSAPPSVTDVAATEAVPTTVSVPTTGSEDTSLLLWGDSDMDGTVSIKDATAIQKHISDIELITHETALKNADVNEDGKINITDATAVQKRLVEA